MKATLVLVAALARNRVIGREGDLPWRLPADLRHFRALTTGHRVLMGRRTWTSLGRALPGRDNVVVTTRPGEIVRAPDEALPPGTSVRSAASLTEAIELPALPGVARDPLFVIGGGALYAQALPLADELRLTEIDADVAGDVFFPLWAAGEFEEVARTPGPLDEPLRYSFVHYRRCRPPRPIAA